MLPRTQPDSGRERAISPVTRLPATRSIHARRRVASVHRDPSLSTHRMSPPPNQGTPNVLGLQSNFGPSLVLSLVAFSLASVGAVLVGRNRMRESRPWLAPVARILTAGAIAVVVLSTALPDRFELSRDGDLVLQLGRAGLGDWRRALGDPSSLPSIQLFANVLLYVPVGFGMVFGWYHRRHLVLAACLALSVAIETVQLLALGRVAALDDVILNLAGAAAGYGAATMLLRFTNVEIPTD